MVARLLCPLTVELGDPLLDLKQAGPTGETKLLEGRGDRQADGLAGAAGVSDH